MKNRTSLTMVISLLVCILTTGAFAQTNPSVLKPEDSTLEARPSDLQPAQVGNANGQCAYKVVPGDKVYLQIKNVKLRSDNLPLYPYFYVFGMKDGSGVLVRKTSSQEGYQICTKVPIPSRFLLYFDNTYDEHFINVYSDYGDQLVARGVKFKTKALLNWAKNTQNAGKIYPNPLEISKGNTIKLKFDYSKKDRYYYFEIVSYEITNLDKQYVKYLHDSYKTKLSLNSTEFTPEKIDIGSNSVPLLTFNNKSEVLLSCKPNLKYVFTAKNSLGVIDTIELFTNEVVKQLNDCMQKYPYDRTKWVVKCVSKQKSEIELSFAGIPRHYILDAIVIPRGNPIQADPVYGNGYAPKYYIEIIKKGETKPKKYWDQSQGWIVKLNIPEPIIVREGMGEEFTIKIENWFTPPNSPHKGNKPIYTFLNIRDTDLKKRVLVQKLPLATLPSTAIKVQVHDMENQINNLDSLKLYLEIQQ